MSKVLVGAKKRINPYEVGKIAVVASVYLLVTIINFILWYQGLTFEGDPGNNIWMLGGVIATCGHLIFTGIIAHGLYSYLDTKSEYWNPYSE